MKILCLAALAAAAWGARERVTVEAIPPPERLPSVVWSPDGKTFVWRQANEIRLYDVGARKERRVVGLKPLEDAAAMVPPAETFGWVNRGVREREIQWFPDGGSLLVAVKGDLFRIAIADGKHEQLTNTRFTEHDPKVSPDGRRVSFRAAHDLYVLDAVSKSLTRLTRDGSATRLNGELDWVYPEELAIGTAHWWSPDSRSIAYLQFDTSGLMIYPHGDLLPVRPVSEPQRYPQAGTPNPVVRLGVVGVKGGKTRWYPAAGKDDLLARVGWAPGGAALSVLRTNRVQDRMALVSIDLGSGKERVLAGDSDPAWVNVKDDYAVLDSGEVLWGSERSGFRHLYLDGKAVTSGSWEVTSLVCVDKGKRLVYYESTEPSPLERHLWVVGLDGNGKRRLTQPRGSHSVSMAPACGAYLDTHSSLVDPVGVSLHNADGDQLALFRNPDKKVVDRFDILPTELVTFPGADGTRFHARILKPAGFVSGRKYPAIVMVYGGPHAQNVRDQWRGADFDQALAHRGFVLWQMDNRGTAGRGHVFETPVNRKLGKQELADQLEGVKHLISLGFVDPARIGVHGWSYGGYMTLNAMFHGAETFRAGVAGAPVTDWRQYDTIYTERYMGLPSENEQGYKESSPVHAASKLKGALMLVHNFEDDNVLFQHTMRMNDQLQQAGKHFDLLLYPQKAHGVTGEVRTHMLEAMARFFERHLKP